MIVDRDGNVIDAAVLSDNAELFECFRVRVILSTFNGYKVIGEEDFKSFPTDKQILYCIGKHNGDFASIEKIYTVQVLPFSEDDTEDDVPF